MTPTLAALLLSAALAGSGPIAAAEPTPAPRSDQRAETLRRFGIDPASPLESRVRETPASVMELFAEPGTPQGTERVFVYEPMKSSRVLGRVRSIGRCRRVGPHSLTTDAIQGGAR